MKTLRSVCISFLIAIMICGKVSAQWEQVFNDTTLWLNAVRSFHGDTVLACGLAPEEYVGIVVKSFDGGESWDIDSLTYPGETSGLSVLGIFPADDTTVFFGVKDGLFKTPDFCGDYEYFNGGLLELIYSAYFSDKNNGILASWPLSVTHDGGLSFIFPDSTFIASHIFYINDTLLYIAGYTADPIEDDVYKIVKTSDFGENLDLVYIMESYLKVKEDQLYFVNELEAYLGIDHDIYHTTDAFQTVNLWHTNDTLIFDNLNFLNGRLYFSAADDDYPDNDSMFIGFIDTLTNIETFEFRSVASSDIIDKLYFDYDTLAYAVSGKGKIFRNRNIGADYTDITQPLPPTYRVEIYPNPANNILTVKTKERGTEFIITDIYGRILPLKIKEEGNGMYAIDLSDTAPGVYLLKNTETQSAVKFIKL